MPELPYITAVIKVGDSATCLLHFIQEIEYDDPHGTVNLVG